MNSGRAKYIVFVIILLLASSFIYCDEKRFQRISVEQGLSHGSVYSIIQDRDGFMWFGTGDGLNKYDGYDFKIYRYDPSDPDSIISGKMGEIYQDSRGIIWIGTWGSGLSRFDPHSNHFFNFKSDPENPATISHNRIEVILEDRKGNIWIGTEKGGLNKLDPVSMKFTRYQNNPDSPVSLINDEVKALCEDPEGNLWIGTDGGLSLLKIGMEGDVGFIHQVHIPGNPDSLSNNRIRALCVDIKGHIWVGTKGGGISIFDPEEKKIKFRHFKHIAGNSNSISENSIASLYRDSEGDIWIGTYNKGLNRYCLKDNKFSRFYHDSRDSFSLSHNRPETIFEDHSKNLWIGTLGGGINKLDLKPKKFKNYMYDSADKNSLPHPGVRSISQMENFLYIGTEGGLTRYDPEKNLFTHYKNNPNNKNSISGNRIWSVMADHKGYIWAGTFSNGLNKILFKNGKMRVTRFKNDPSDENSLSFNRVQVIFEDNDGDIWAGTSDGLNVLKGGEKNNRFQRFFYSRKNENTLSDNYIIDIYQDSSGIVWIGTLKGLNSFDKITGTFTRFFFDPDEENSLSNNTILTITESILNPGVLWIGTDDGGLNRFDVKKRIFNRYLEKDGLPGNVVSGILEDDKGFLWLSTNGGLSKFDPAKKTFKNYKKSSGIEGLGFVRNSSLRSRNGELYFGSITGMISFLPEDVKDNPFVPRIVITSFKKLGEEVKTKRPLRYNDEIRLTHKENFISIEFAALDYTNVKENRYSYFLKGVDYGWMKCGSTRFASYNHLSPGNYLFSVSGSNNDGIWSEKGASLKIVIVPAYWQTWWFRIIVISLVFFLIALLYRMRVNRITRTNRKLSEINLSLSREIKSRREAAGGTQGE
ncbi:MAG: histidine kinase [Candidatus Aminicenantes bacterium]|nr:histidine kinase [Candidatus Aminicenantes bacterium]